MIAEAVAREMDEVKRGIEPALPLIQNGFSQIRYPKFASVAPSPFLTFGRGALRGSRPVSS